jgi:hypothetical protein
MIVFKPGDADRHGKGTAWTYWSRRCGRQVHAPTTGAFHYGLSIEFDASVASYIEQPVIDGPQGKRVAWPAPTIWFYVERKNGRRELHCRESLETADDPTVRTLADQIREGGVRFVAVPDDPPGEHRIRNLVRLLGLVGDCEGAVNVCVEQLKKTAKAGASQTLDQLIKVAADLGSIQPIAARAFAILMHEGSLRCDLDADVLSGETLVTWA